MKKQTTRRLLNGFAHLAAIPLRAEPREQAEMVNQLIFGDHYQLLQEEEKWYKVKSAYDGYEGWMDKRMACLIDEKEKEKLSAPPTYITTETCTAVFVVGREQTLLIGPGCSLPSLEFTVQGQKFRVQGKFLGPPRKMAREELVGQALKFLGIPYAWGGRNPFGLDCSGFVQLVYKIGGAFLPRDAGPQAETGKKVERFGDRKPGDLAFFAAGRGISHVGICMPGDKILHASGMVRADKLDETGIFNEESGGYTHQLVCIRNVLK